MKRNDVRFQNKESCVIIPGEYCESIEYWLKKNEIPYEIEGLGHKPDNVDPVFFEEDGSPRYDDLSCLYTHVVPEDMLKVVNAIVFDGMVCACWCCDCDDDGNPTGEWRFEAIDNS